MITHIGKQLATQIVDTVHDVCGHDINFINKNGLIYASTNTSRIGSFHEIGKKAADTGTVIEVQESEHYKGNQCRCKYSCYTQRLPDCCYRHQRLSR